MPQHIVHRLDALNGPLLAMEAHPRRSDEHDPLVHVVRQAVDALVGLNARAASLDPTMPADRKRETLAGDHAALLLRTQRARAALEAAQRKHDEARAKLETPPRIEGMAEAIMDSDLRRHYDHLPPEVRAKLDDAMAAGQHGDMLAALARFGPGADAARARDQYRAQARAANPAIVAELDARAEATQWAAVALRQVGEALDAATLAGVVAPSALVVSA